MLSYKYRIYPNREQIKTLREHLDICRWTYNALLGYCNDERKAGRITPTAYSLMYLLTPMKKQTPQLQKVHSLVLANVADRVRSGFENFWTRKTHGLKAGLPHFRKKGDYYSLTYRQSGFIVDNNNLILSKIGFIKINLHRPIEGKIKRVTVLEDGEKWYVSFSCETEDNLIPDRQHIVGIDMGLISLVATSDGDLIEPPKTYRNSERRLKRLGRQLSKKKLRSKNWYKSKARLSKLHGKVANQRKDFIFNVSRSIVNKYETIVIEDLKISNMQKNHKLAKSIGDAGWGEIKRTLGYMSKMSGGKLILVNPNGTSQICPKCGKEVHKTLSDRIHNCPSCGLVVDRDIASAMEIRNRGLVILERDRVAQTRINACGIRDGGNADLVKAEQRPASMNQESLTSNREGLYKAPSEISTFTSSIPEGSVK